jgi:hypothetical protein
MKKFIVYVFTIILLFGNIVYGEWNSYSGNEVDAHNVENENKKLQNSFRQYLLDNNITEYSSEQIRDLLFDGERLRAWVKLDENGNITNHSLLLDILKKRIEKMSRNQGRLSSTVHRDKKDIAVSLVMLNNEITSR